MRLPWGVVLGFIVVLPCLLISNSRAAKGMVLLFLVWVVGLDFYFSEKYENCSVCKLAIPAFLIIAFDCLIAFFYIAWVSKGCDRRSAGLFCEQKYLG